MRTIKELIHFLNTQELDENYNIEVLMPDGKRIPATLFQYDETYKSLLINCEEATPVDSTFTY